MGTIKLKHSPITHECDVKEAPMAAGPATEPIKAYWQPGCTSCLRMKEYLTRHGVPFVSVNVLAEPDAFAELAHLGVRSVPIVQRGADWANGQVLRDVARVAGIPWGGAQMLPVDQLFARLMAIQATARRLFAQIPPARVTEQLGLDRPLPIQYLTYMLQMLTGDWGISIGTKRPVLGEIVLSLRKKPLRAEKEKAA